MTAEKLHDALTLLPADLIAETNKKRSAPPCRIIHWKRYASIAACLALCLCGTLFFSRLFAPKGATESMKEAFEVQEAAEAPAAAEGSAITGSSDNAAPIVIETQCASAAEENEICGLPTAPAEESVREGMPLIDSAILCEQFITPDNPDSAVNTGSSPKVTLIRSRAELEAYWGQYASRYDFTDMQEHCDAYDEAWFEENDMLLIRALADSADTVWEITNFSECGENGWEWEILFAFHTITAPDSETTSFHILTSVKKGLISPEDDILPVSDTVNSTVNSEPFSE